MSFGFILQAPNNDPVIAIRGTEGIREWTHDFEFLATKCPFLRGGQAKRMMASPNIQLSPRCECLPSASGRGGGA